MHYYTISQTDRAPGLDFDIFRKITKVIEKANPGMLFDDMIQWGSLVFCAGKPSDIKIDGADNHVAIKEGVAVWVPKEGLVTLKRDEETFYLTNGIASELKVSSEKPEITEYPEGEVYQHIKNWYINGDTGLSSLSMCAALYPELSVAEPEHGALPQDYADFGRCMQFIHAVPGSMDKLDEMREVSPEWDKLVDKWEEIEAAYHAGEVDAVGSKLKAIFDRPKTVSRIRPKAKS